MSTHYTYAVSHPLHHLLLIPKMGEERLPVQVIMAKLIKGNNYLKQVFFYSCTAGFFKRSASDMMKTRLRDGGFPNGGFSACRSRTYTEVLSPS